MKLKSGLILRQIADQFVIVPTGKRTQEVHKMIYLSSSAAFLWDFMKDADVTADDLTSRILETYTGVTREEAAEDIHRFIAVLQRNNLLEPEEGEAPKGGCARVVVQK